MPDRPLPPPEVAWLVNTIGEDATLAVIREHAGTRVFVPHNPAKGVNGMISQFDAQAAERFAQEYGGLDVRIPSSKPWRALLMRYEGASNAQIAKSLGLDRSSVTRILQRAARAAAQGALGRDSMPKRSIEQLALNLD